MAIVYCETYPAYDGNAKQTRREKHKCYLINYRPVETQRLVAFNGRHANEEEDVDDDDWPLGVTRWAREREAHREQ